MKAKLGVMLLCGFCCAALAQEGPPDLLGTWKYSVSGLGIDARCGQAQEAGELDIDRKISARAFRGKARIERSFEKCQGSSVMESAATIRLKDGNIVTVEYDEEGWMMDHLDFVDGEMSGNRGKGVSTDWVRSEESGDKEPTAEQLALLDEFLSQMESELSAELSSEYSSTLFDRLKDTGLNKDEAKQVAAATVDRMTACMLDLIRESVIAQDMPIEEVLTQQNAAVILNPQSVDMRANECVQDASWNAGVRIR